MDVYTVSFKGNRRNQYVNTGGFEIEKGTHVIVEAERGEDYGTVERKAAECEYDPEADIPRILRQGNDSDSDRMIFNPGSSARYFVDQIDHILEGEKHPDWCYLNW